MNKLPTEESLIVACRKLGRPWFVFAKFEVSRNQTLIHFRSENNEMFEGNLEVCSSGATSDELARSAEGCVLNSVQLFD